MASQRNTILRAAAEEVAAVGLRRTTLTDVARRAGVSRMTVYREYGDAAALFRALLTESIGQVVFGAEVDVRGLPTARERIVESAALSVERLSEHPMMRRVLELDPELLLPFVTDRFGSGQRLALEHVRGQLRAGMDEGSIRPLDVGPAARLILLTAQSVIFSTRIVESEGSPAPSSTEAAETDSSAHLGEHLRWMLDAYLRSPA
ncbi:MAG TPA: TetR/AcrR family transcriptional regulator [Frankiaceae bacterium]|nr:TetR/AcrR family transcriptional regulator [Frankiaceae bacterium]